MRIISTLLLITTYCFSSIIYVRSGATGSNNGTDWDNAYTDVPSPITRGDTVYIADGSNYAAYECDDAVSGTDSIWILKATASAHGTETGWQSTYGDGQAIFADRIRFTTSYWYVSGVVGGGYGLYADTTSYGFKVAHTGTTSGQKQVRFDGNCSNIYYGHIDHVYTQNTEKDNTTATDQDNWYSLGCSYVTTAYCSFRYAGRVNVFLQNCTNLIFEYCYFYYPKTCTSQHSESWADSGSDNVIIRHSVFRKNKGTGIIVILSRGPFAISDNWEIYGNVFWGGERSGYDVTDGAISIINGQEANGWKIYNNTLFNLISAGTECGINFNQGTYTTGGHEVYNNLAYNNEVFRVQFCSGDGSSVSDYNYYIDNDSHSTESNQQEGTGNPFTDYPNYDFTLISASNDGYSLSSPYNVDAAGITRGADAVWDRGAYEFVSSLPGNGVIKYGNGLINIGIGIIK